MGSDFPKSLPFHVQDGCFAPKVPGRGSGLLWFTSEVFKTRQSNYRPDSPQRLQSAKFKRCKILTRSDKYIMRELLKCKLPAFWYCRGARHRTPEPAASRSRLRAPRWRRGGREMELGVRGGQGSHTQPDGPPRPGDPQRDTVTVGSCVGPGLLWVSSQKRKLLTSWSN